LPENGWSLFGLARSLELQKKSDEAAMIEARFQKVWSKADVRLPAHAYASRETPRALGTECDCLMQ
jgi:hypothetical protein